MKQFLAAKVSLGQSKYSTCYIYAQRGQDKEVCYIVLTSIWKWINSIQKEWAF